MEKITTFIAENKKRELLEAIKEEISPNVSETETADQKDVDVIPK